MVVKAPAEETEVTNETETPNNGWADLFVNLKDLAVEKPVPQGNPILEYLGVPLVLLAVRSEDGKRGDMDFIPRNDVEVTDGGELRYPEEKVETCPVPRGGMRVLAAAAKKANGRAIVLTPYKKNRGIGFE